MHGDASQLGAFCFSVEAVAAVVKTASVVLVASAFSTGFQQLLSDPEP